MTIAVGTSVLPAPQYSESDLEKLVVGFRPLADWWSNRIQWCEDDHEDLVQEGMLELVKTIRGYQRSGKPIQDMKGLASVCFSAAMKWWYKKSDRTLSMVDYDTIRIPIDNIEIYFSKLFVDGYLVELERVHGAIARAIVEQLIEPGEEVAEVAMRAMAKKKVERDSGKSVIGYASPRVQKQHIRQVYHLDTAGWDRTMADIKSFTRSYVCRDRKSVSGSFLSESTTSPAS